jgi:peroxiredoxin Q/BCP
MLLPGQQAPKFTLPDQNASETALDELLRHGPLVLFFYPADFTPICTQQTCLLRDFHGELLEAGISVAGISPDAAERHAAFRSAHALPYTLLSDPAKKVIRLYDADGPLGFGVRRISYVIDETAAIRDAVRADWLVSRHKAFVQKALARAIVDDSPG